MADATGPVGSTSTPVEDSMSRRSGPCRTYPTPSEFTQHLQNLPNTFRIYPTPSEFTHPFRIYPTPSEFTQHLQNLPNTFRIYPTLQNLPTTFRMYPPLQNLPTPPLFFLFNQKNRFWDRWTFLYLFGPVFWPQKRRFWQKWDFGEIDFGNDRLHMTS